MAAGLAVGGETAGAEAIKRYFAAKAAAYDDVDLQAYWRLSDSLLREILTRWFLPSLPGQPRILDAGAGTGRWSRFLRETNPAASLTLLDMSEAMLGVARGKFGEDDRVEYVEASLAALSSMSWSSVYDGIICFHNVIGFCPDPAQVLADFARVLRPGGVLALMAPNTFHAAYFNLLTGRMDEAERIVENSAGTFAPGMPALGTWTPRSLRNAVESAGLTVERMCGFPVLIYPGYAETQLHGESAGVRDILGDEEGERRARTLEQGLLGQEECAARGNNLLCIARRP